MTEPESLTEEALQAGAYDPAAEQQHTEKQLMRLFREYEKDLPWTDPGDPPSLKEPSMTPSGTGWPEPRAASATVLVSVKITPEERAILTRLGVPVSSYLREALEMRLRAEGYLPER